jgi:hypothetical protein
MTGLAERAGNILSHFELPHYWGHMLASCGAHLDPLMIVTGITNVSGTSH